MEKSKGLAGTLQVTRSIPSLGINTEDEPEVEVLQTTVFQHPDVARASISLGITINLKNYESAKVTVGMDIPCYKEEIEEAYEYIHSVLSSKVEEEVKEIREAVIKSRRG